MFRLKRTDFIVACALNTKRKWALYKDLLIENGILEEACELNTKNTDFKMEIGKNSTLRNKLLCFSTSYIKITLITKGHAIVI